MAAIVETMVGDRRLQLGNEEFVRQMGIGTLWTKIRIGFRYSVNGVANIVPSTGPVIGVCQGTTNTYYSANTTDFVGATGGGGGGSLVATNAIYQAGPPATYYLNNNGALGLKRTGSTTSFYTTGLSAQLYFSSSPATTRTVGYLDITKASGSYTVALYHIGTALNAVVDWDSTTFLSNMLPESNPASPLGLVGNPAVTYTGAALFDTVSFSWTKSSPTLELSDLCVCRFY